MHIAMVYPYFNKRGGVERYLWELCEYLSKKHQITLVASTIDDSLHSQFPAIQIKHFSKPNMFSAISFSIASFLKLRGRRFDLISVQGASCLRQDLVTAQSCHKAWYLNSLKELRLFSSRWWLKFLNPLHHFTILVESIQYRKGNHKKIIAVSELIKKELECHFKVPRENILVIHSGVNTSEFHPEKKVHLRQPIRSRYGFREDDLVLVFVANEFRRKGLQPLLQAIQSLENRSLKLLVVGKDNPKPFKQMAMSLGIGGQVMFLGASGEVSSLYAASDIFVLPTTYEAFGLVITEAMASGLPVVASADAGASELISNGVDGILVHEPRNPHEIANAIKSLYDPTVRAEMGKKARTTAEQYSWEKVGARIEEAYNQVLKDKSLEKIVGPRNLMRDVK